MLLDDKHGPCVYCQSRVVLSLVLTQVCPKKPHSDL